MLCGNACIDAFLAALRLALFAGPFHLIRDFALVGLLHLVFNLVFRLVLGLLFVVDQVFVRETMNNATSGFSACP